jgi:hypothetical protein
MSLFRGEFVPSFADKVLIHYDNLYCDPNSINDGDTVYCDTHHIIKFKDILNSKNNITIITHNSDYFVCDGQTDDAMGVNINEFTNFKFWYAQNCYSFNPNVFPIPIGFENTRWEACFGPKTNWLEKVTNEELFPQSLIYFNCNQTTNLEARQHCYAFSVDADFVTIDCPTLTYSEYLRQIKRHKFTLSPRGNGLDCHRTWEVLKLKRVPILKREGRLEDLYTGLPVLFVNEWNELYTMNLDEHYESFCFKNQDYLEIDYWVNYCVEK